MGNEMKTHRLTIVASGLPVENHAYTERLFEAGCDDATVSLQKGRFVVEFEREATSFEKALESAIHDVRTAGATIKRIEPDHLVNASDIAARGGITRAAVSMYAGGKRGEGFPAPIARITTDSPLWDWVEVAEWLVREKQADAQIAHEARVIREANKVIVETHKQSPEIEEQVGKALSVA
jgi:predicted transcriptional regulator